MQILCPGKKILSGNEILVADLKSQYVSLFNYFKNFLHGNASIFYSFNNTLGGNMFGTYAYYLSSPLNFLLVFSSTKNIPNFMFLIILIKIGLSGLFMNIFLNHKKSNYFYSLIFSCFYALMAYNVSYYFNLMWLDCVYMAPLVLYGVDNILKDNNGKLYIVALSLTIIFNFYIAYMVCIFIVIYFLYELFLNYEFKDKIRNIKTLFICSFISLLISSFILVPTIINMGNIMRSPVGDSMFAKGDIFNNFLVGLSKLYMLPQNSDNILCKYTPNIYFGILPLLFCLTYFYSYKSNKDKILTLGVIIIFYLCFSVDIFNLFWHGFTYPNGYAYRNSFLFSLFMLLIGYITVTSNIKLSFSKFLLFVFVLIFIGNCQLNISGNPSFSILSIVLTVIFFIIYYFISNRKSIIFKIFLMVMVFVELFIQVHNSFLISSKLGYDADYSYYIDNICSLSNSKKYRFDSPLIFGAMESFTCDDMRIAGATSFNNKNVYNFFYNTGYDVTYSTVVSNDDIPVINSLMSVKKYLSNYSFDYLREIDYYFGDDKKYSFYLKENENVLPIGYVINDKYNLIFESRDTDNPFEYQNALINSMSGLNKDVFIPYEIDKIDDENYSVDIINSEDIYVYVEYDIPENDVYFGEIIINDDSYTIDSDSTGIFRIKNDFVNTKIDVKSDMIGKKLYFYYLDNDIFNEHINVLKKNVLNVDKINKNYLVGNIELKKSGILFLSIPYEDGWNIYVDGKKVDYFKLYDTFIGIKLSKGSHDVKMVFYSPGINVGLLFTFIGIIAFLVYKNNYK